MKYPVIVTPDVERELRTIYRYIRKQRLRWLDGLTEYAAPLGRLAIFQSGLIWRPKLPRSRSRLRNFFMGRATWHIPDSLHGD